MKTILMIAVIVLAGCPLPCDPAEDAAPAGDAQVDARADAEPLPDAPPEADADERCGGAGQLCCTADPLHPCDPGLTCGVPPQNHCIPVLVPTGG